MKSARRVRDPLLALEFLSLTFACGSRPLPGEPVTSESTGATDASEGMSIPTSTSPPDPELTDDSEATDYSDWNQSFLDGYHPDPYAYWECDPFMADCPDGDKCVPVADE